MLVSSLFSPIATFNTTLAELGRPWRIEPVTGMEDAYVLSTTGPVTPETLVEVFEQLGEPEGDLAALDDHLSPLEPWTTLGGFVLTTDEPEASAHVAAWAASKMNLTGLLSPDVLAAAER